MKEAKNDITILSRQTRLRSERFFIEQLRFRYSGSEEYSRDVIRHPGAVVVLAIDSEGRQIFVSQPRVALGKTLLELPAGTRNQGEDPLSCAQRELAEETGFAASDWQELGSIYPALGFCDEQLFLFVARGLSRFSLPADEEERITVINFDASQVNGMILDGSLQDAKSLALLLRAKLAGFW